MIKTIMDRRSVRSYDGKGLTEEEKLKIRKFADSVETPFGIKAKYKILEAADYGLTSPVLTGVETYIAGKTEVKPYADLSFGYGFEKILLYVIEELGLGTVWIAGTMNRAAFENAMDLEENEIMPCMSPLGHTAKKMSVRETLMRKGVKADSRLPYDMLFFEGDFTRPITGVKYGELKECLETVRWSPSAVNKQPWRVVISGNMIHFYEHHDKGYVQPNGMDLQKVDLGIAVCHFDLALGEKNIKHSIAIEDPGISLPEDTEYICTFILE